VLKIRISREVIICNKEGLLVVVNKTSKEVLRVIYKRVIRELSNIYNIR
jgi:hypothetical protein